MKRLFWIALSTAIAAACANERPQRPADMNPSSPDAPAGQVIVPDALKPSAEEKVAVADESAKGDGHDHGAMTMKGGADAGGGQGEHMAHGGAAAMADPAPMYTCPMHPEVRQATPGKCPKCGMKLVLEATDAGTPKAKAKDKPQAAQIYTCPMHPEVQQAGPGECPKCGMKLVPKAKTGGGKTGKPDDQSGHGGH